MKANDPDNLGIVRGQLQFPLGSPPTQSAGERRFSLRQRSFVFPVLRPAGLDSVQERSNSRWGHPLLKAPVRGAFRYDNAHCLAVYSVQRCWTPYRREQFPLGSPRGTVWGWSSNPLGVMARSTFSAGRSAAVGRDADHEKPAWCSVTGAGPIVSFQDAPPHFLSGRGAESRHVRMRRACAARGERCRGPRPWAGRVVGRRAEGRDFASCGGAAATFAERSCAFGWHCAPGRERMISHDGPTPHVLDSPEEH